MPAVQDLNRLGYEKCCSKVRMKDRGTKATPNELAGECCVGCWYRLMLFIPARGRKRVTKANPEQSGDWDLAQSHDHIHCQPLNLPVQGRSQESYGLRWVRPEESYHIGFPKNKSHLYSRVRFGMGIMLVTRCRIKVLLINFCTYYFE